MSSEPRPSTPAVFPTPRYQDAASAIDWLVAAFGFERGPVVADENGAVAHAELRLGTGVVMPGQAGDGHGAPPSARQTNNASIPAIDAHHARAAAAGAEILSAPFYTDSGSRDAVARNLDGDRWDFGAYAPDHA